MALTPRSVFRYYETDGVPSSGKHEPIKAEIIQLLEQLFGTSRGGWVVARTKTELDGITPESETDGGVVLTGSDAGYYDRDGGAWVFGRGFPDTFARVELSGGGTAQNGVLQAGVNPFVTEVFFAFVGVDNTGPLTLSIAGETPREVVNLAGNPLAAGEWTGAVMFARDGAQYRLLLDAGAAASAAQSASEAADSRDAAAQSVVDAAAEADRSTTEADRAQANADDAAAFAGFRDFADVATLFANTTLQYGTGAGQVQEGDVVRTRKEGFSYQVLSSGATDFHREVGQGVKINYLPNHGIIDVQAFGALGAGDNYTEEVQLALDFGASFATTQAGGATVVFPAGDYVLDTVVLKASVNILGMGWGTRILPGANIPTAAGGGAIFLSLTGGSDATVNTAALTHIYGAGNEPPLRTSSDLRGMTISGLFFEQTDDARRNIKAMWFTGFTRTSKIEGCNFRGFVTGGTANEPTSGVICLAGSWVWSIERCYVYGVPGGREGNGIALGGAVAQFGQHLGSSVCNHFEIRLSGLYQMYCGINFRRGQAFSIWNNDFEFLARGIRAASVRGGVISGGNYFESIDAAHIFLGNSTLSVDNYSENVDITANFFSGLGSDTFLLLGANKRINFERNHYHPTNTPLRYVWVTLPGGDLCEDCYFDVPSEGVLPSAIDHDRNGFYFRDTHSTQVAGDRSGTGANGSWKKHPDGTLECWNNLPSGTTVWTFPVPFVGTAPIVTATCGTNATTDLRNVHVFSRTLTSATFQITNADNNTLQSALMVKAIGRWRG